MADTPVLYSYWRSSCAWRVRFALSWKNIDYDTKAVHLVKDGGEQLQSEYVDRNPMKEVPTLNINNISIVQSMSILEYLEEVYPDPPLLPKDPVGRAKVRSISQCISSGIQPLQNLRVLKKLGSEKSTEWGHYWIEYGFIALEKMLNETAGKYCYGDELTFADLCLIPQVYNANRFNVDMSKFPIIKRVEENISQLEACKKSHPSSQPDCPEHS